MKIGDDDTLANILIDDGISGSDQDCAAKGRPSAQHSREETRPSAASAEQIEKEVADLLHRHANALSQYALSLSNDSTIVQDGIQETFLRYFAVRISGQKIENPRAWLIRVLRNFLLDCNRKCDSMRAAELREAARVADLRQDLEVEYQQNETIQRALSALSRREAECLQLRLVGFGYEEVAQILQIRSGTVGALLARALKKIRIANAHSRRR